MVGLIKFRQKFITGGSTFYMPPSDNNLDRGDYYYEGLQENIDDAKALSGGRVMLGNGTYPSTGVPVLPGKVSLIGQGIDTSRIRKIGAAASPVVENWAAPRIGSPIASGPNAVLHLVEVSGGNPINWSFAECRDFSVEGDGTSAMDTGTAYGVFANGINNAAYKRILSRNVLYGHWHGVSIVSEMVGNIGTRCYYGFYQHFGTAMQMGNNYANRVRYAGFNVSYYYSQFVQNSCDQWGDAEQGWLNTDVGIAYQWNNSLGTNFQANGCESGNGTAWEISFNAGCSFRNNLGLDIYSTHDNATSGLDVGLLFMGNNADIEVEFNRASVRVPSLGGSAVPANHYNWRSSANTGVHTNVGNRFVEDTNKYAVVDTAWTNTSGVWPVT